MAAAKYNIVIEQFATWRKRLLYRDSRRKAISLTGYGARMQIRDASGALVSELSTDNGKIVLGAVPGAVDLHIPDEDTALMVVTPMFYDLKLIAPNGDELRFIEGKATLSAGQTR